MKKKFLLMLVFVSPIILSFLILILDRFLNVLPISFFNMRFWEEAEFMKKYLYASTILGTYLLYKDYSDKDK
ncbi:MAG: hypothetical protein E6439_00495 [Peptoniphilus harei]|nr:hypothetical protein [Peptoniphilus harei]